MRTIPEENNTANEAGQTAIASIAKTPLESIDMTLNDTGSIRLSALGLYYSLSQYADLYANNAHFQSDCQKANIKPGGFKAVVYYPYTYITNEAIRDLQLAAANYPRNKKQKHSIDYSPYFTDASRRNLGKRYSDFLVSKVRTFCKDIGMAIPPKNEPLPDEAFARLLECLNKKAFRYCSSPFFGGLNSEDFNNKDFVRKFTKKYLKTSSPQIRKAMDYFADAYPGDEYLGQWKIFWSNTPSSAKDYIHGGNGSVRNNYDYEMTPYNSDGTKTDPMQFPMVIIQIAFTGKHLDPAIVGLINPRYGIDIEISH